MVSRMNTMLRISRGFSEITAQIPGISRVPIRLALEIRGEEEEEEQLPNNGTDTHIDVHITVNNRDAADHDLSSRRAECKESSSRYIFL